MIHHTPVRLASTVPALAAQLRTGYASLS